MASVQEAQNRLGELFIIGFEGHNLPDDTSAFLSQAGIGGVILFSHNYESPEQVAELINQVQDCRGDLPFWISTDQEGGRVQRFKEGFTEFPPGAVIGKLKSPKTAFSISELLAKELKAVGVNLNFNPVVDILTEPNNPVIGDRAYGSSEAEVTKVVTAMVRGHLVAGVQPCVKHFPGHGHTTIDSHEDLPRLNIPLKELQDREFRPFVKAFKSRCNFVMTAHILNEAIDPDFPATLSSKFLQEILRKELRYSRVIVSDDLEMKALTNNYSAEEIPVRAIDAGCDLLIYRSEDAARKGYQACFKALEERELPADRILESASKLRALKDEFLGDYQQITMASVKEAVGTDETKQALSELMGS